MSKLCSRKAASMSRWVRGIYNSAANFVMSGSLRAASGRTLGGKREHVRESSDQRNQHVESSQSGESSKLGNTTDGASSTTTGRSSVIVGNDVIITDSRDICNTECNKCHPTFCDHIERDYADYTASIRTEGQGAGARIRVSNEPRYFERTNNTTRTNVEHVTGIPTGVAI
jgi:hypothetical protein